METGEFSAACCLCYLSVKHRAYGLADIQINELNARESLRIGWQGQGGV